MPTPQLQQSVYTQEQLEQYLAVIGYPYDDHVPTLENLERISRNHLVALPFENSEMHYTESHTVDVSFEAVFKRLVVDRLGGSYCFGQNRLLLEMLKLLGYRATPGTARVHQGDQVFGPTSHMLLFVQLPSSDADSPSSQARSRLEPPTYLVDVGYGGSCPVRPILLEHGAEVRGGTASERHRLVRAPPREGEVHFPRGPAEWYLDIGHTKPRSTPGSETQPLPEAEVEWRTVYAFFMTPGHQLDYTNSSFLICHNPNPNPFKRSVMCVKYFFVDSLPALPKDLEEAVREVLLDDQEISMEGDTGKLTMYGDAVKVNVGRRTEVLRTMKSEEERRELLRLVFGVHVKEKDVKWILGREAALV